MTNKTLVVILGPTGSGKTDLAVEVARHFDTEIISADSRQIFRGMAVGTAQPSPGQLAAVAHHLIASEDVTAPYNPGRYEQDALRILGELFTRHDVAVAVGGSGLYIDALCEGLDDMPAVDPQLREKLIAEMEDKGLEALAEELAAADPEYHAVVDRNNPQRVIRALEVIRQTDKPFSSFRKGGKAGRDFNIIKIGASVDRAELYERIDRRVDAMMAAGLEAEARALYPHREFNALQTVGYRELFEYFDGSISLERAVELIKRNSRRYAKRQMTWFARDDGIAWFPPDHPEEVIGHIEKTIKERLK